MFLDLKFRHTIEQQLKIRQLRKLVENNKDLEIGTEDVLLTKFLNYAKWNVDRANDSILRYYDFKKQHPDWVAHHTVQYFRDHFFQSLSKFVMPKPDKEGRVIVIFRTVDAFKKFPNYIYDTIEMDDLIFESLLLLPRVQKYGITMIYDLSGTTKNFIRLLSPSFMRVVNMKNDILPITSRIIHFIQRGFLMNTTASMILPFLSKEIKERMFTHDGKNFSKLQNMVGYESLPSEYGGPEDNNMDVNIIYNHLLENADYLLKLQAYKKR